MLKPIRFTVVSPKFTKSCGFIIFREGEKTSAYLLLVPITISERILAAAIEDVIPHLLKPVATYKFFAVPEYKPI